MEKINIDKIIGKAKQKKDPKVRMTFALDSTTVQSFHKKCMQLKVPQSRIIEEFMKEFVSKR